MGYTIPTGFEHNSTSGAELVPAREIDPAWYGELDRTLSSVQQTLQVDCLTLLLPSDDGQAFVPVRTMGFPAEEALDFRIPRQDAALSQLPVDLEPVVVEDPAAFSELSPMSQRLGIRTLTMVPLTLDDHLHGILHLGWREARQPGDANPRVLSLAGHAVALAIDRVELKQAEAKAREEAAVTRERLTFLAIASSLLSSTLDYETTLSQITGMLVPRLADICSVVLTADDGSVNQITIDGRDPHTTRLVRELQTYYSLRPGAHSAVRRVLDTGKTEFHQSLSEDYYLRTASGSQHLDLLRRVGMRSMVIVPLHGRGATIGALSVAYTSTDRRYAPEDVDFIEELAHRAALAVENARLFQESQRALEEREESLRFREETLVLEREARARAEASQQREAFLSEASNVLSTSLDYAATLEDLASLVVSRVADWCTIEVFDDSGASSLVAAAHAHPSGAAVLSRIREEYLPATIPELPPRHVLRYRKASLITTFPDDFWFDSASSPEHLLQLDELKTSALIIVPLFARNRTLGIMMLGRSNGSESFDGDDVSMAVDLGYRVALAIDNSGLYTRAQKVVQQQEEFISTASHELKTPLTTVKGYLQLINRQLHREDFSPERIVRFTQELDEQVRRLEDLVSDLLDVSRIQQGGLDLRLERFDLAQLASSVLSRFEHAPERRPNHELSITAPEPVEGTWDRGRIDQVLTNLISNALKYSPDGGQILVRVRRAGDSAELVVRDNGIGIGQDEKANLFQPFVRGRNLRHKISGTGLGLYITQRIVQNHRGSIFVKSQPGHGTTFTVHLPLTIGSGDQ